MWALTNRLIGTKECKYLVTWIILVRRQNEEVIAAVMERETKEAEQQDETGRRTRGERAYVTLIKHNGKVLCA